MLSKKIGGSVAIAAVLAFSASTIQAQPNLLVDPNFDGPFTANPIGVSGVNQGWALFDSANQNDMSTVSGSPYGSATYAMNETLATGNNWETPGAYQIVTGITPGQSYTFTVQAWTDTGFQFQGCLVQLGFEQATLGGVSTVEAPGGTFGIANTLSSLNTWTQLSVTATAPAGYTDAIVYLMCQDYNNIDGNNAAITAPEEVFYDNATLTAVPEPSTLALLAMGLGMPFYFLRRKS